MHRKGALTPPGDAAHPATIPVPLQDSFPQTAEVLFILPPQRVAGRAATVREDLVAAAAAVKGSLRIMLHGQTCGSLRDNLQASDAVFHSNICSIVLMVINRRFGEPGKITNWCLR